MPGPFLKSWCAANLKNLPPGDRAEQASELASKCIADAAMCGIFIDDLEQAAGGSVLYHITKLIADLDERSLEDMLKRVRPKDAKRSEGPEAAG